jgi:hypothetical protein
LNSDILNPALALPYQPVGQTMTAFVKYPLGIQTFSKIREQNYLYIDKTALVYDLIQQGEVYFFSRPRRFGKSLLISTFEAVFSGQKALFEGLAIADTDYDFIEYPVILMEFSKVRVTEADDVKNYIINSTNKFARIYDIDLEVDSYEQRFDELVTKLQAKSGRAVVLLIDEYDKPILDNLLNDTLSQIKSVLNGFYTVVKSLDRYLKFIFITGVSKFAKVSVFSGMNNLTDISMDRRYATLCGITQQELETNFLPAIDELVSLDGMDKSQVLAKIKYWYNGYKFHHRAIGVYNPYSVLALCNLKEFRHFWFSTATPTFLIELIKAQKFDLTDMNNFELDDSAFMSMEPEHITPLPVLVQTGYLTITGFDDDLYTLDFPNYEVKYAFNRAIVEQFGHTEVGVNTKHINNLNRALNSRDIPAFFKTLGIFFANIPFDITLKDEKYYQSLFYAILTLLGYKVAAEVRTNIGRIDCVLQTDKTIYIIEFKLNDTKEAALQQIHDKKYAEKYLNGDKGIVLLGVEFDQKTRNIGEYLREDLPR